MEAPGALVVAGARVFAFDAPRAFTLNATATRFDPSRFVAMPAAKLDGTVDVRGTLLPRFDVTGEVTVARGSQLAGLALAGRAKGHVTPAGARDMALEATLGSATVTANGGFGGAADALTFAADVPHVEELAPLLAALHVPPADDVVEPGGNKCLPVRFEGQVTVFDPKNGPTYRDMLPEPPPAEMAPSCAEAGVLGALPGIIGTIQAVEAIKLILGAGSPLIGRYLTFDALDMEFREYKIRKDPNNQVTWENRDQIQVVELEGLCQPAPLQAPANA